MMNIPDSSDLIIFNYQSVLVDHPPANLKKSIPFNNTYLGFFDLKKQDEQIYLLEKKHCYKSFYKVRMMITAYLKRDRINRLLDGTKSELGEIIEFNAEIDFSEFPCSIPYHGYEDDIKEAKSEEDKDRIRNYFSLDEEKLLETFVPEKLKEVKERLTRFLIGDVPTPIFVDGEKKIEFLEFTNESASGWAGPYELNGKLGAYANFRENKDIQPYRAINPATDWTPYGVYCIGQAKDFCEKYGIDQRNMFNEIYEWSKEKKEAAWIDFPIHIKHKLYCHLIRDISSQENISWNLPYALILSGNDDCSYTAFFATEKGVEEELLFLRKMQPLCFTRDILNRNYVFTN